MLKSCILPVHYNNLFNKTCGEIICQSETSFTIICKFCDMKIFQFSEFVEHIRFKHWPDIKKTSFLCKTEDVSNICDDPTEKNVKIEFCKDDNRDEIVCEEYNLDEPEKPSVIKIETNLETNEPLQDEDDENSLSASNEEEWEDSPDMYEPLSVLRIQKKSSSKTKGAEYKCNVCSSSFVKKSYLDMHKKQKHKVLEFQCSECNRSFAKDMLLKQHQFKHTGYPCEECGKIFKLKASLGYHMDTHKGERKFVCDFENCGKAFMNKRRLSVHKRVHLPRTLCVCEICGSRQINKYSLIDHIRTHTGEKPFQCKLCDHRFTSKTLLREHKACHETDRKHICSICGKSFNRQKALYHHKHLHLDIKKFVCKICGAAYAQAAGLSAHMRKHKENNS